MLLSNILSRFRNFFELFTWSNCKPDCAVLQIRLRIYRLSNPPPKGIVERWKGHHHVPPNNWKYFRMKWKCAPRTQACPATRVDENPSSGSLFPGSPVCSACRWVITTEEGSTYTSAYYWNGNVYAGICLCDPKSGKLVEGKCHHQREIRKINAKVFTANVLCALWEQPVDTIYAMLWMCSPTKWSAY